MNKITSLLLALCSLFVISCSSKHQPPVIKDTTPNLYVQKINNKALGFINSSYKIGSLFHDNYGLILPYELIDSSNDVKHVDQGDSLMWNSIALSSMCMIQQAVQEQRLPAKYDLKPEIKALWNSIKNNLQLEDGRWIRHPSLITDKDQTQISNDLILGSLFMGTIAYHTNCDPVKSEYKVFVEKFADYGRTHKWEMGGDGYKHDLSVTWLKDRSTLKMVLNLYDANTSDLSIYLPDDLQRLILKETLIFANYINKHKSKCLKGSKFDCALIGGNKRGLSVFGNHLAFLKLNIGYIESLYKSNSLYKTDTLKDWYYYMGRIGDDINAPNWLFTAGYRSSNLDKPTFHDAEKFLVLNYPNEYSGETEDHSIKEWGCTTYLWQRVPIERCNDNKNIRYTTIDFLFLFSIIQNPNLLHEL
ncbi:MAG: hypothetical protein ACI86H_001465 [bacterium]|jgi:hypothetical protein